MLNGRSRYDGFFIMAYKYKFNGMEWQDELGLNLYDMEMRDYDPAIGRWMNIDPLAEKMRRFNPFTYAGNNPVIFIDPDGMEFVNGETAKRQELQRRNDLQQQRIQEKYNGNTNMGKKDFASKEEYKEYKSNVKSANNASKALSESVVKETKIQTAINDFQKNDPVKFDVANNLSVDIVVNAGSQSKVKDQPMHTFGGAVTETGYTTDSSGNKSVSSINTTLDFGIVSPVSNVLAHEAGHAVNNYNNPNVPPLARASRSCRLQ